MTDLIRYEYYYEESKDESACVDINECNIGSDRCDENALCFNEPGGYQCRCKAGYNGDGFSCQSGFLLVFIVILLKIVSTSIAEETICSRVRCAANSQCVETEQGHAECRCLDGYQMTENQCQPIGSTVPTDCRHEDKCDINAQCTYSSQEDRYLCRCFNGYRGDGTTCTRISGNLLYHPSCHTY